MRSSVHRVSPNPPAIVRRCQTLEAKLQTKRATLAAKQAAIKSRHGEGDLSRHLGPLEHEHSYGYSAALRPSAMPSRPGMETVLHSISVRFEAEIADLERQPSELVDVDPLGAAP